MTAALTSCPTIATDDPNETDNEDGKDNAEKDKPKGTIVPSKKVWRPKLPSRYIEPDECPDLFDGQEILFKEHGLCIRKSILPLPPREDIIQWNPSVHQAEFDRNIRWGNCPEEIKPQVTSVITKFWDVFCEDGLKKNIRGFSCRIDTGDIAPICCKPPRYGPHEAVVMDKLLMQLYQNDLIEPDDGPWGALIVLAAKPNQEEVPWHQYIWRLCVSYR